MNTENLNKLVTNFNSNSPRLPKATEQSGPYFSNEIRQQSRTIEAITKKLEEHGVDPTVIEKSVQDALNIEKTESQETHHPMFTTSRCNWHLV